MEEFEKVTAALKGSLESLPDNLKGALTGLESLNAYLTEIPRVQAATKEELLKKPQKELVRRIMKLQTRQTRDTAVYSHQRSREEELKQSWQRKVDAVKGDVERLRAQLRERDEKINSLKEENAWLNSRMGIMERLVDKFDRFEEKLDQLDKFNRIEDQLDQLHHIPIKQEEGDTQPMDSPLAPLSDALVNVRSDNSENDKTPDNLHSEGNLRNDEFVSPRKRRISAQRRLEPPNPSEETCYSSSFLARNDEFYQAPASQGSVNDVRVKEEPELEAIPPPSSPFLSQPIENTPKQKSFGQTVTPDTTASPKRVYHRTPTAVRMNEQREKRHSPSSQGSLAKRAKTTSSESSEGSQWTKDEVIRRIDEGEKIDDSFMRKILTAQWHPNNFKINKNFNEQVDYAFKQDLRKHNCNTGGHTCKSCQEFYKAAGPLKVSGGLSWNASSARNQLRFHQSELVTKASRHRQRFEKADTPPGFFNSDFPSTQEQIELRKQEEEYQNKIARPRLMSAVHGGKYLFRDVQINNAVKSFDWDRTEINLHDYNT